MNTVCKLILVALGGAVVALTGCSDGDSTSISGIGGTGKIASGTITGFGSIFVNGVEYRTDRAAIVVDDGSASEADLRLGMVVRVTGTVSDGTGNATEVVYDAAIEGPVSGLAPLSAGATTRRLTVMGTEVAVSATGSVFDDNDPDFSFETIANGDVVEVSGFFDALGVLQATYVGKAGTLDPGATEVELKGAVTGTGGAAGPGDSFTLQGISVEILPSADLSDVPGGLVIDGMFVEVRGLWISATTVHALRIELEDPAVGDEGDDVSLEGLVTNFTGDVSFFLVGGRPVDATTARFEPAGLQIANDLRVEVEGIIDSGGVLVAEKIESRGGRVEVQATVAGVGVDNSALNEGRITLQLVVQGDQSLTVQTNSRTVFRDDTGALDPLRLADIRLSDYLQVRGFIADGGGVVASEVRRADASGADIVLQGPVSGSANDLSVTVLGVTFSTLVSTTEFEDALERPISSSEFYGALSLGRLVKLRDDGLPGDGIADQASLED